ncbi:MAG: DM13 domain-containing protein [Woeseia sp.]
MIKVSLLFASHLLALLIGFVAGIYALPILTAPSAPSANDIAISSESAVYTAEFRRDLEGSDLLHWGEGSVSVGRGAIAFAGQMSPGPDYKLYLTREFVETEEDFLKLKDSSVRLGDVKTFESFIVSVPEQVEISEFNSVVVWCESFSQFITAAQYR